MLEILFCIVIVTILNISCIVIGFTLSCAKSDTDVMQGVKKIFLKEDGLEEAYIPEED